MYLTKVNFIIGNDARQELLHVEMLKKLGQETIIFFLFTSRPNMPKLLKWLYPFSTHLVVAIFGR